MKNLFDFATKELSQDAFLRWLFENYDDEELGEIVIDFINYFTKKRFDDSNYPTTLDLKKEDIRKIKTKAQLENIDITVDIYFKDINREHISIVIEDKTFSGVGKSQLSDYNKKIQNWKYGKLTPKQCVYKIFYKTSIIKKEELEKVIKEGWNPFSIHEIYNFFNNYKSKTTSQIFNQYVDHICKLYNDSFQLPKVNPSDWNSNNWKVYIEHVLNQKYGESGKNIIYSCESYNGFYNSIQIRYPLKLNKHMKYVNLELIIRDKVRCFIRPIFIIENSPGEHWSLNDDNLGIHKSLCEQEINDCRNFFSKKNNPSLKRRNHSRSIAKVIDSIDYKNMTIEEFEIAFLKIVEQYVNYMDEYSSFLKIEV